MCFLWHWWQCHRRSVKKSQVRFQKSTNVNTSNDILIMSLFGKLVSQENCVFPSFLWKLLYFAILAASFRFIIVFTWSFITYLSWPRWINLGTVSYIWFSLHQLQGVSVWEYFRFQRLFLFSRNRKQTNKQRSRSQNKVFFPHHTWSLMKKTFPVFTYLGKFVPDFSLSVSLWKSGYLGWCFGLACFRQKSVA